MPTIARPFAIADAMVDEAEDHMPPRVLARLDMHLCVAHECSTPALPQHDLCQKHYREVLAEIEAWGASRTLRESGAVTVRDLLELVCVVSAAQFAGLAVGLLLV